MAFGKGGAEGVAEFAQHEACCHYYSDKFVGFGQDSWTYSLHRGREEMRQKQRSPCLGRRQLEREALNPKLGHDSGAGCGGKRGEPSSRDHFDI